MVIERLASDLALLVWLSLMVADLRVQAIPFLVASLVLAGRSRRP